MLKLIKYEFRKQLLSKIIILVTLFAFEAVFLVGYLTESDTTLGVSILLLVLTAIAAIFFVSIEAIITFSNDLKTKHSYMLFMTPHSPYTIVGAKVITSIITIFVTGIIFLACAGLDIILVLDALDMRETLEILFDFTEALFGFDFEWTIIIPYILLELASLCATTVFGFIAITISATLLSNVRGRGVVSVVLFFAFMLLRSWITNLLVSDELFVLSTRDTWITVAVTVIFAGLAYFFTGLMLKKKVNL